MADLWWALALVLAAGVIAGGLGVRLGRGAAARSVTALAVAAIAAISLQLALLRDSLLLARLLPSPAVPVLGTAVLPAAAFLAGLACSRLHEPHWRRLLTLGPLVLAGAYLTGEPLLGRPPACGASLRDGLCLQTSEASCSAACAATLLRQHGLAATEAEMARLCLTRSRGTPLLGLYRGLWLKTRGTPWQVRVVCGPPAAAWPRLRAPAILSVGLARAARVDPRYEREWGWRRGARHAVLLLEAPRAGKVLMGDPSIGRERWSTEALEVLWHGEALCLEPRH